jgi:hypothetical protein
MAKNKIVSQKKQSEGYSMLAAGVIMIVLSILIFADIIYKSFEKKEVVAWLGLILGILTVVVGVISIRKELRYRKSVLFDMLLFDAEKIKNKLSPLKILRKDMNVIKDSNVTIVVKYNNISYEAYIHKTKITFIADCEDEYYQKLNDNKKQYLDSLFETHNTLLITKEEVLDKFIKFIEKSKDKI